MSRDTPRHRLSFRILDSYRGRYLILAISVITLLLTSGVLGYRYVADLSAEQLRLIQARSEASDILHNALEQLGNLQQRLHGYLINPPQISSAQFTTAMEQLSEALAQLEKSHWVLEEMELTQLADEAVRDAKGLEDGILQLIRLRQTPGLWFPVLGTIEQEMLPNNEEIQALISDMLNEEQDNLTLFPTNAGAGYRALVSLQGNWLQATAELRLLISNRFGIFASDAMHGIEMREHNVRLYLEAVEQDLEQLQNLRRQHDTSLLMDSKLDSLVEHISAWKQSLDTVVRDITNKQWRADLNFAGEFMEPLLTSIHHRLSGIRLELDIQSRQNITKLTGVSQQLSMFSVLLAVTGTLLIVIAYWFFSRGLLQPIEQTTLALKQEARGLPDISPPRVHVRETRDLVAAFEEMRQQVRERQSHLDHLAHHDPLTGLPNRLLFRDRLEHALALSRRDNMMLGVMFLDLDRFKQINDSLGHAVGDKLLHAVSSRLSRVMRSTDTIARLGGDEFAILAEQLKHRDEATLLAEKVLTALEQPFDLEGRQLHVTTSIGITLSPNDDTDPDRLIRGADAAMYDAKQSGKACFRFFTADMTQRATEYLELETSLRKALGEHRFDIHYQPITCPDLRDLHACEALIRWHHPEMGTLPPERFIPILEATGQLGQVSSWIMESISEQQHRLLQLSGQPITVSVNLTARLLLDDNFSSNLLEQLARGTPRPEQLIVEVTEDSLTQDLEAAGRVLKQLRDLGVRTALDDFGTGQSSLNHLRHFPFDLVKVDREFVRDIPDDPNDVTLVGAIIQLSHAFGMKVVAEGVETRQQADMLRSMGCDYLQGFLISQPMSSVEFGKYLQHHHRVSSRQAG